MPVTIMNAELRLLVAATLCLGFACTITTKESGPSAPDEQAPAASDDGVDDGATATPSTSSSHDAGSKKTKPDAGAAPPAAPTEDAGPAPTCADIAGTYIASKNACWASSECVITQQGCSGTISCNGWGEWPLTVGTDTFWVKHGLNDYCNGTYYPKGSNLTKCAGAECFTMSCTKDPHCPIRLYPKTK